MNRESSSLKEKHQAMLAKKKAKLHQDSSEIEPNTSSSMFDQEGSLSGSQNATSLLPKKPPLIKEA